MILFWNKLQHLFINHIFCRMLLEISTGILGNRKTACYCSIIYFTSRFRHIHSLNMLIRINTTLVKKNWIKVFSQIFLPLLVLIEILSKENIAFLRNFDWRIPIYYFNKDRNKRQIPIVGILKEFTYIYFYKYIHVNR